MANHQKHRSAKSNHKEGSPKAVSKRYKVTSQTAYHITEIALQEGLTEGRVIDKIMRTYLANRQI